MGKAVIASGGTSGSYQITIDYGKAARDAKVIKLTSAINTLATTIAGINAQIATQTIAENAAKAAAQAVENAYIAKTKELGLACDDVQTAEAAFVVAVHASYPDQGAHDAAIAAAQAAIDGANAAYKAIEDAAKALITIHTTALVALVAEKQKSAKLQIQLSTAQTDQTASTKEKSRLQSLVLEETRQAWCADLTETATGSVATIEIPGESKLILVAPAASPPTADDGALSAREIQSPEQVFWNAAVLPGWQKYKPAYRRGTITAINSIAETANVTLYPDDKSSAQSLIIDQASTLSNVPVQYMSCHTAAFEVGDKCVVKFIDRDWTKPKIVGFVDNPKACLAIYSGYVKEGAVVDIGGGKWALHSFKPTTNAWINQLKSDPARHPLHNEVALAKAGTQYADLRPTMFSGLMAKAVQIIMGRGKVVAYDYRWAKCHGISKDGSDKFWLVQIGADGVLAMPLPVTPGNASSPNDAIKQATQLFNGVPSGAAFPTGAKLAEAVTAGTVKVMRNAAGMTDFYGKSGFAESMGWSFNATGSEAHNTCWDTDSTNYTSYHYKLAMSFGAIPSASLTLVSQGDLTKHEDPIGNHLDVIPLRIYDHLLNADITVPQREVPSEDPDVDGTAPLIACHINGSLEVLRLVISTNHSYAHTDTGSHLFDVGILPGSYVITSITYRPGRRIVYESQPEAEFGYDVRYSTSTSFSTFYFEETTVKAYTNIGTVRLSEDENGVGGYVSWNSLARDAFTVFETPSTTYTLHNGGTWSISDGEAALGLSAHYSFPFQVNPLTGENLPGFQWVWTGSTHSGGNLVAVPNHTDTESTKPVKFVFGNGNSVTMPDSDGTLRGMTYVDVTYSIFGSSVQQVAIAVGSYYYALGNLLPGADTDPKGITFIGYT